jgi:hypothetical protein
MNYRSYKKGALHISFSNGDTQKILFDGLLLRPNIKYYINIKYFIFI